MQPHSVCSDFFVALACHFPQPALLIYLGNMENLPKKIRERWESVWCKLFKGVTTRRTNGFCSSGKPVSFFSGFCFWECWESNLGLLSEKQVYYLCSPGERKFEADVQSLKPVGKMLAFPILFQPTTPQRPCPC